MWTAAVIRSDYLASAFRPTTGAQRALNNGVVRHYVVGLTVLWAVAFLAIGYPSLCAELGDPRVPVWLVIVSSFADAIGGIAWWFLTGWCPMTRRRRIRALLVGTLLGGWGIAALGWVTLSVPGADHWSTLDGPEVGYLVEGMLLPVVIAVPAALIAATGYLARLNLPTRR